MSEKKSSAFSAKILTLVILVIITLTLMVVLVKVDSASSQLRTTVAMPDDLGSTDLIEPTYDPPDPSLGDQHLEFTSEWHNPLTSLYEPVSDPDPRHDGYLSIWDIGEDDFWVPPPGTEDGEEEDWYEKPPIWDLVDVSPEPIAPVDEPV